MMALHGNPYDGHTLKQCIEQTNRILGIELDGDVFDNVGRGDAVFGSAIGNGRGDDPNDWDLEINGVFFGTAD